MPSLHGGLISDHFILYPTMKSLHSFLLSIVMSVTSMIYAESVDFVIPPPSEGEEFSRLLWHEGDYLCLSARIPDSFVMDGDSFLWKKDGEALIGESSAFLEFVAVTSTDSGMYQATLYREGELVQSGTAVLVSTYRYGSSSNISARHFVDDSQAAVAIAGFVIVDGGNTTPVLLRAITNSLEDSGISNPAVLASVSVFNSDSELLFDLNLTDTEPSSQISEKEAELGAFPSGDGDWTRLRNLVNGAYTIVATPAEGTSGTVLLEVYFETD